MYATNLLVTDGREMLLRGNVKPRFAPPDRAVNTDAVPAPSRAAAAPATGSGFFGKVFVPARPRASAGVGRESAADRRGTRRQGAYDEVVDDPVLGCVSPGMPRVMLRSGPYAIRFIERGADLVLQNEWFEIDRTHSHGRQGAVRGRAVHAARLLRRPVGRRSARDHDDPHRLAVLRALRPRRRAAEQSDAHRRAVHAGRRRRHAALRLLRDRSR